MGDGEKIGALGQYVLEKCELVCRSQGHRDVK